MKRNQKIHFIFDELSEENREKQLDDFINNSTERQRAFVYYMNLNPNLKDRRISLTKDEFAKLLTTPNDNEKYGHYIRFCFSLDEVVTKLYAIHSFSCGICNHANYYIGQFDKAMKEINLINEILAGSIEEDRKRISEIFNNQIINCQTKNISEYEPLPKYDYDGKSFGVELGDIGRIIIEDSERIKNAMATIKAYKQIFEILISCEDLSPDIEMILRPDGDIIDMLKCFDYPPTYNRMFSLNENQNIPTLPDFSKIDPDETVLEYLKDKFNEWIN